MWEIHHQREFNPYAFRIIAIRRYHTLTSTAEIMPQLAWET